MKKMMKKRFTAIELILVCAVVAILFTIAMPAFTGLISGTIITRGANQVASKLSLARAKAVARRKYVGLVFDEESYRMAEFKKVNSEKLKFVGWMEGEGREFLPHGLVLPKGKNCENFCCGKPSLVVEEIEVEGGSGEEAEASTTGDEDDNSSESGDDSEDTGTATIIKEQTIEKGTPMPVAEGVPSDLSKDGGGTANTTNVIVFRPSGTVFMVVGKETNKVSMRFAEGFKTPGSQTYELKKDSNGIINYANLLISAMSGQPTIEYVQTLK